MVTNAAVSPPSISVYVTSAARSPRTFISMHATELFTMCMMVVSTMFPVL